MKTYERLEAEVVRFEAQDVITASVAAPAECICGDADYCEDNNGVHVVWKNSEGKVCPAEEHEGCMRPPCYTKTGFSRSFFVSHCEVYYEKDICGDACGCSTGVCGLCGPCAFL